MTKPVGQTLAQPIRRQVVLTQWEDVRTCSTFLSTAPIRKAKRSCNWLLVHMTHLQITALLQQWLVDWPASPTAANSTVTAAASESVIHRHLLTCQFGLNSWSAWFFSQNQCSSWMLLLAARLPSISSKPGMASFYLQVFVVFDPQLCFIPHTEILTLFLEIKIKYNKLPHQHSFKKREKNWAVHHQLLFKMFIV